MTQDVLELDLHRRAPPEEAILFRHTSRHMTVWRGAAAAASIAFVIGLVAGAPAIVTLVLLIVAGIVIAGLLDAQRRTADRPAHMEVSAAGLNLAGTRPTLLAWSDIAVVEHDRVRSRIVIGQHDGRTTAIDTDLDDAGAFLDAVTLHVDASRRTDISPPLDRAARPAAFQRHPWAELAALATTALGAIMGLLARPALFLMTALGVPALVWRWATDPHRVIVDDSAVWIVRRFARDVIPLRAIRDVAFGLDGRPLAPSVIIDHRERGYIVLHGFGAHALPMFDAIIAALRAQRALRAGAGATAVRSGVRTPAPRSALATGGILAAAFVAIVWITVLTGIPLRTAVLHDNGIMLQIALLMGAPRNAADADGLTALHHAAARDDESMVRRLIRAGANVEARSEPNAYTPLHKAAQFGSVAAARALIAGGADLHALSQRGRTPLAHALIFRSAPDTSFAQALLDAGADPNTADAAGRTALHHAARNGHATWIPLLVRAGANLEARDTAGRAPLHYAVRSAHTTAITTLLDAGADIDARGWSGRTAIASAVHDVATPLPVIDLLLASRARVDISGNDGWNAVQLAAFVNNAPAIELFGRRRFHVDATAGRAAPALHVAIRRHNVEAVRALLRAGASPSRPFFGTTAYDVARATDNPTITALVRMR